MDVFTEEPSLPDRETRAVLLLAVALTAVAGCVDAIGFLRFAPLFVSFMSGDSTQFAVGMSGRDPRLASLTGGAVFIFVLGVVLGRLLSLSAPLRWRRALVLGIETLLLLAASATGAEPRLTVLLMVLAMGVQNAAIHKAGQTTVGLTYVTGTLVHFGERLADALFSRDREARWAWLPYLLLWAGLIAGAVVGAAAYRRLGLSALLLPAAATAGLCAVAAVRDRNHDPINSPE